jgi:short-subunit dehydrogenase
MNFAEKYGPWAVVTGAAAGMGLAYVRELHRRGLGVVLVDVDPAVEQIAGGLDGLTRTCVADVADPAWTSLLAAATEGLEVGLAIANAGVGSTGRFLDLSADRRRLVIDVNCHSTAELAAWALPSMVERRRGGFIATSSGSALAGTGGVALYSATKAFAVNLVEAIGWELRERNIDTLAVVAPMMDTPGLAANAPDATAMFAPPADPAEVAAGALDQLHRGGRWLADPGLEFAAGMPRAERVDALSSNTVAMFPHLYRSGS